MCMLIYVKRLRVNGVYVDIYVDRLRVNGMHVIIYIERLRMNGVYVDICYMVEGEWCLHGMSVDLFFMFITFSGTVLESET